MIKYPKTPRLQEVLGQDLQREWRHLTAVVEEKVDGANVGVSFDSGALVLQSRGHVLRGGPMERQFELFKQWGWTNHDELWERLGHRYVMFGEWLYAKNRTFYDALPAYFLEFDVYDKELDLFLPTPARQQILAGGPAVSVLELHRGPFHKVNNFAQFVGLSHYKSDRYKERFEAAVQEIGDQRVVAETDPSPLMEGVYVKVESQERVVGRMKLPRPEFEKVRNDDRNWHARPIFPNLLRPR